MDATRAARAVAVNGARTLDGVLVVDKPQGLTSHDVVAVARRCLREKRIGHTGTLDPLATGVLPLACGRATRLVRFLVASDKDYEATIRFGVTTDSYDVTGAETSRTDRRPTRQQVDAALAPLRGGYLQRPPAFSAKKIAGARAYDLARSQQPVDLAPVPVRVMRADILEWTGENVTIALTCSAGFYVRTFAHELGRGVGTGACLEKLRRTRSGGFQESDSVSIQTLQEDAAASLAAMVPMDRLLTTLPEARVTAEGRARVAHGREVDAAHIEIGGAIAGVERGNPGAGVRLLDQEGHLIGIGAEGARPGSLHPFIVLI